MRIGAGSRSWLLARLHLFGLLALVTLMEFLVVWEGMKGVLVLLGVGWSLDLGLMRLLVLRLCFLSSETGLGVGGTWLSAERRVFLSFLGVYCIFSN